MSCGGAESWTFGDRRLPPPAPALWKDALQINLPTFFLPDLCPLSQNSLPVGPPLSPLPVGPSGPNSSSPSRVPPLPKSWYALETLDYGQLSQDSKMLKFKGASWSSNYIADKRELQGVSEEEPSSPHTRPCVASWQLLLEFSQGPAVASSTQQTHFSQPQCSMTLLC